MSFKSGDELICTDCSQLIIGKLTVGSKYVALRDECILSNGSSSVFVQSDEGFECGYRSSRFILAPTLTASTIQTPTQNIPPSPKWFRDHSRDLWESHSDRKWIWGKDIATDQHTGPVTDAYLDDLWSRLNSAPATVGGLSTIVPVVYGHPQNTAVSLNIQSMQAVLDSLYYDCQPRTLDVPGKQRRNPDFGKCTCGAAKCGGLHSNWCDIDKEYLK